LRTDPQDPFLYHKTTRRALYDAEFRAASAAGFADILFLNAREEITEGAISNLFLEIAGRWYTPALNCGLLAGVFRRHLMAIDAGIEERVLTLNELKAANGVYLSNAVRGLRKVTFDGNARLFS
jgi:para-aminobenzoate synthetase/4-amino-4-deoxychorismate lyase